MKKIIFIIFPIITTLFFYGCSKENLVGINNSDVREGGILLSIQRKDVPQGVQKIIARLFRTNYDTLETNTNITNDSLKILSFGTVPVGNWHLRVDAENSEDKVIYTGESDVTIIENKMVDVYITLTSTGSGTGNVRIFIDWGNKWIDFYNNPIFTSNNNPDYPLAVTQPRIIYDNGIYKIWYLNLYSSAKSNIWYAESNDGINWHNVYNQAVLTAGDSGSWDDYSVAPGFILKEDNYLKMYYNGYHDQYGKWNIGLAVSTDGIHWEKNGEPVLIPDDKEYQIGVSSVIKHNSTYFMYYSVRHYPYYSISLATSIDGVHWTKYENNPILIVTEDWEGTGIYGPSVIFDQNHFEMVYMNADANAFGFAVSEDGINWTKNNSPIFTAGETTNNWTSRIAYPDFNKFNSELRIYYTGFQNYNNGMIAFVRKYK